MVEFSKTFILKNGIEVLLRLPQKEDADALLVFANVISKEDTFITMSGETLTLDEEITYLREYFGISNEVLLIRADKIENEDLYRQYFGL